MALAFVYLCGGISSRFGGKIKALAQVGPQGAPFLSVSMRQARDAGFDQFLLITSSKTKGPIKAALGESFDGAPITYVVQDTPSYRERPLGTAHAALCAKGHINGPFGLGSSDDLFGAETYRLIADRLRSDAPHCVPGYVLHKVLPEEGKVNRAILRHDEGTLAHIEENHHITKADIGCRFKGDEHAAMLIYGLHSDLLGSFEKKVQRFLAEHPDDPRKEILLPDLINELVAEGERFAVIPTADIPLFLTFPEDEESVRRALQRR